MRRLTSLSVLLLLGFAAFSVNCGGGGGGGSSNGDSDSGELPPPASVGSLVADCSDSYCGAAGENTYSGSGIGVWVYRNNTGGAATLPISLNNVRNKTITLIYTNETPNPIKYFPPINISSSYQPPSGDLDENQPDTINHVPDEIESFDPTPWLNAAAADGPDPVGYVWRAPPNPALGDRYDWWIKPANSWVSARTSLRKIGFIGDQKFLYWVEDSEYGPGKITDTILQRFHDNAVRYYPIILSIANAPWGPHTYGDLLISPSDQPINVVFVNFAPDGSGWGLLGYFWSFNNFKKQANPSYCPNRDCSRSNEALSVYLDSETVWAPRDGSGIPTMISTLAHEMTHMFTFYQRNVLLNNSAYQNFLTEMTAMMMEDVISQSTTPPYNDIKNSRYKNWLLSGRYNCNLAQFGSDCGDAIVGYNSAGSFGAFLLRHYGIAFFKQLLIDNSDKYDQIKIFNHALSTATGNPNETFERAVQRWSGSLAQLPDSNLPNNYGYPQRFYDNIDLIAFPPPTRTSFPSGSPSVLQGYALFPFSRRPRGETYSEEFYIPAGVSLTVIVK